MGTGYRTSERSARTPIQVVNLVHLPHAVLSARTWEADMTCSVDWRLAPYLDSLMSLLEGDRAAKTIPAGILC